MRGTEFFTYGKSEVAEGHTPREYADKQKEDSLNKAGKIDVEGFMGELATEERCFIKTTTKGKKKLTETELDKNAVYTVWYNEASKKWMYMSSNIKIGADDEFI